MKNNYIFQFDINTRGWQIFTNWKINEPLATMYGKITYSVNVRNQKRQHLLVSGAKRPLSYLEKKTGIFANWLYTVNTNSWQNVGDGNIPPIDTAPVMIQLCAKIIALESDELRSGKVSNLTGAWIFDTVLLNWQKTQVDVDDRRGFSGFIIKSPKLGTYRWLQLPFKFSHKIIAEAIRPLLSCFIPQTFEFLRTSAMCKSKWH